MCSSLPSPASTLTKMNWSVTESFPTRHLIARSWTSITSPNARECGPLLHVARADTAMLLLSSPWQAEFKVRGCSSGGIHWAPRQLPCAAGSWLNTQERHGPGGCYSRQDHITRSEETIFGFSSSMALLPEMPGSPRGRYTRLSSTRPCAGHIQEVVDEGADVNGRIVHDSAVYGTPAYVPTWAGSKYC